MAQSGSRAVFSLAQDRGFTFLQGSEVTSIVISIRIMVIGARSLRHDDAWVQSNREGAPVSATGSGAEQGADTALATMRHRLRLLGGNVDIERTPGGDTH